MTDTMRFTTLGLMALGLAGCVAQKPVVMAPPVAPPAPAAATSNGQVYNWRDVPTGQEVPVTRAVFDQGGYQLYAASGETIAVPFENQNLYAMKFGKTSGAMYFVNDGSSPTLYVREGMSLENAAAQGARWYPFPANYAYTSPVYMGIAPSWSAYNSMGWYPGMVYHGGYYSSSPWVAGMAFGAMAGLMVNVGGRPYYGWNNYSSYYRSNPVNRVMVTNSRSNFNYSSAGRRGTSSSFGRSSGSTGSFGRSSTTRPGGGGFSASRPSFGSSGRSTGTTGTFGRSTGSTGGGFSASRPSFGSSSSSASRPSFGSSSSSGFGSSTTRRSGSFGSGSSGFSSSRPSFGGSSSFGRSSGGSFGGGRSFGGGGRRR